MAGANAIIQTGRFLNWLNSDQNSAAAAPRRSVMNSSNVSGVSQNNIILRM